eukprot:sb/3473062/
MEMQLLVLFKVCTTSPDYNRTVNISVRANLACPYSARGSRDCVRTVVRALASQFERHVSLQNRFQSILVYISISGQPGTETKARCRRGGIPSETQGEVPSASPTEHSHEEVTETEPTRAEIDHPTEHQAPPTPTETTTTAVPLYGPAAYPGGSHRTG